MRRFSRSWRRFIAASERWRPSSSVALAMVSLPERRRSSSPLARARFSSTAGAFSATFFGPTGRPASARAACACAAAGSTGSAAGRGGGRRLRRARRRGRRPRPPRRRRRRRAARRSRARGSARSAASFSARSRASSASRASAASRSFWRRSASWALAASTAFRRRSNSASDEVRLRAAGRGGRPAPARRAGLRDDDALALVLDRDRLGPAVAEALAHVAGLGAAAAQPERLALAVAVLGIHHSVLAFPAGAFPRRSSPAASADGCRSVHIPDARQPQGLVLDPVAKTARQHGGMYHTIAGECQTQFVRRKGTKQGCFRPPAAAAAPRSRADPSAACRSSAASPETSAALVFSSPATAWPALRASATQLDQPAREQRLDLRRRGPGGTRTARLAARAN